MQAVMSSDVAIAQFSFFERLLLVHGHWCYRRISSMICYFFYKNVAFDITFFLYEEYTSFSAQPAYSDWCLSLYNVFFTSLPAIALEVFDQEVSGSISTLLSQVPITLPRRSPKRPLQLAPYHCLDVQRPLHHSHHLLYMGWNRPLVPLPLSIRSHATFHFHHCL